MSPLLSSGSSLAMVSSTGLPCGTMIQMALRPSNFFAMSSSDDTPTLPEAVSFCTASALKSKPITWCPPSRRRSAMLPPILPRPIKPSCISLSLLETSIDAECFQIAPQLLGAVKSYGLHARGRCARGVLRAVIDEQYALGGLADDIKRTLVHRGVRLAQPDKTGT